MSTATPIISVNDITSLTTSKRWTSYWQSYYEAVGEEFTYGAPVVDGLITPITYTFLQSRISSYYTRAQLATIFQQRVNGQTIDTTDIKHVIPGIETAFRSAAQSWMSVANIRLVEDTSSVGDIAIGSVNFVKWYKPKPLANPNSPPVNAADVPAATASPDYADSKVAGDIWFDDGTGGKMTAAEMGAGDFGYFNVLHELGHALGLLGDNERALLGTKWNSVRYSVMSYVDLNGNGLDLNNTKELPSTPMLFDIARIQFLYGANANTATGANNYEFERDAHGWPIQAIWDAGGNDTIDGANHDERLHIDLNPGGESYEMDAGGKDFRKSAHPERHPEIHIAFQPLLPDGTPDPRFDNNFIENAIGGKENDIIIGNKAANNIDGGKGDDYLSARNENLLNDLRLAA
jgi:serralysin